MLYKPSAGRFKDLYIFWNENRFYLFAMYAKAPQPVEDQDYRNVWRATNPEPSEMAPIQLDDQDYRNVWLATSEDGVHWGDVGPVISDAPWPVWAMSVHKVGDRFILNHGSFSRPGVQNVIKLWESPDLLSWRYLGEEHDLRPDERWHHPDSRLDCMDVLPVRQGDTTTYFGYATGPGGLKRSDDGLRWAGVEPPEIDWDPFGAPPSIADGLEIGGCEYFDGRYYLLGGWFAYAGTPGYGVYTLVGDRPQGPFRAEQAYRLCGNSGRWVSMWARYCRTGIGLLVNGYMYSGYTYETGETWLPPLKRPDVDDHGHLRLTYWEGNESLKGSEEDLLTAPGLLVFPSLSPNEERWSSDEAGLSLTAGPEVHQGSSAYPSEIATTVVLVDLELDFAGGVIVEGTISATSEDTRLVRPTAGLFLEESVGDGTAILWHGYGLTQIGRMTFDFEVGFESEDEVGPTHASAAGLTPDVEHSFRLMARQNMFEIYLDDRYVQTFNTTHYPNHPGKVPRRLGFVAQNGRVRVDNLRAWSMNLH